MYSRRISSSSVLFIAHSSGLYGAERSLLDLVVGLHQRGWSVKVVVPSFGAFCAVLEEHGIPYIIQNHKAWVGDNAHFLRIPFRMLVNLWAYLSLDWQIAEDCTLVYTNTLSKPVGMLLAKKWRVPHILHAREVVDKGLGLSFDFGKGRSLKWVAQNSERIICNSKAVMDELSCYIPTEQMHVVHNGVLKQSSPICSPRLARLKEKSLNLCMVGGLSPYKGHTDAIRALSLLRKKGINATLEIAGAGEHAYQAALESLAFDMGVEKCVKFLGYVKEVEEVFSRADIQLICSHCEAFGRVAIESMALGVPVIGSDSGGLPEIIQDGYNGFLYAPGDVAMLASKILILYSQQDIYARFSRQGQKDVFSSFTFKKCLDGIEQILMGVLED
jgi:glycosyltransferase involved in cell wall biosynthesis